MIHHSSHHKQIPVDPFVQNKANKKTVTFEISSVASTKTGRGKKPGVDLRWHKPHEYKALSSEQKDELKEWQNSLDGKKVIADAKESYFKNKKKRKAEQDPNKGGKKQSARIAALEKQLSEQAAELKEQKTLAEIASALKTRKSSQSSEQMSLARQVLKIASRDQSS